MMEETYQKDCNLCCALHRCHFCGVQPGWCKAVFNRHTYYACFDHREEFEKALSTDPRGGDESVTLVVVNPLS